MAHKATLAGVPLEGPREIAWPFREGTQAVEMDFDVAPRDLGKLLSYGRTPVSLKLKLDGGGQGRDKQQEIRNLYIIRKCRR